MTDMRKVVLTIEVNTVLSVEELKTLQCLVFGRMRSDAFAKEKRLTIKQKMPAGMNHDVRGEIVQVQANVVKDAPAKAAKKSRKRKTAAA